MRALLTAALLAFAGSVFGQGFPPIGQPGAGGGSGSANVVVGQTLYVSTNGNNSTAVRNNLAKPWATVSTAVTNMLPGDKVVIGPGKFFENGSIFYVTNGCSIEGAGIGVTTIVCTNGTLPVLSYKSMAKGITWIVGAGGGAQGLWVNDQTGQPTDVILEDIEVIATNQPGIYCLTTTASNRIDMLHCRIVAQECIHIENGGGPTYLTNKLFVYNSQLVVTQANLAGTSAYAAAVHLHSQQWLMADLIGNDIFFGPGTNITTTIDPGMLNKIEGGLDVSMTNSLINFVGNTIWEASTNSNYYNIVTNGNYLAAKGACFNSWGSIDAAISTGTSTYAVPQIVSPGGYTGGPVSVTNAPSQVTLGTSTNKVYSQSGSNDISIASSLTTPDITATNSHVYARDLLVSNNLVVSGTIAATAIPFTNAVLGTGSSANTNIWSIVPSGLWGTNAVGTIQNQSDSTLWSNRMTGSELIVSNGVINRVGYDAVAGAFDWYDNASNRVYSLIPANPSLGVSYRLIASNMLWVGSAAYFSNNIYFTTNPFTSGNSVDCRQPYNYIVSASAVTLGGFLNLTNGVSNQGTLVLSNSSASSWTLTLPGGFKEFGGGTEAAYGTLQVTNGKMAILKWDVCPGWYSNFTYQPQKN